MQNKESADVSVIRKFRKLRILRIRVCMRETRGTKKGRRCPMYVSRYVCLLTSTLALIKRVSARVVVLCACVSMCVCVRV